MLVVSPVIKVAAPATPLVTIPPVVPPPANEPIVSLVPFKSKVTPATSASVTAPVLASAAPPLSLRVPALIVVRPV